MIYILPVLAYLSGSLPFGWWIGRYIFHSESIRHHGSGATGSTQLLRTLLKLRGVSTLKAWVWFVICAGLDMAKAFIPVVFAIKIGDSLWYPLLIGWICCIGHVRSLTLLFLDASPRTLRDFTFFQRINGGKAMATAGGAAFAFGFFDDPSILLVMLAGLVVLAVGLALTRKMSVGSLAGASTAGAFVVYLMVTDHLSATYVGLVALVPFLFITHIPNIFRLIRGEEPEINEKRSQAKKPA